VLPLANGTALVPRISAQWQYAFGDVTPAAGLAFQGTGAAFSVAGVPIARNTALIETGFDWRFSPQAKLGAFYQGELASHAQAHAFKGTFTWDF
jgi:subtilase-type serine protease